MEFFNYHPLKGEKFQLVHQIVGLSLAQVPTGIGYYSICAILVGLVENSSQTRMTGIHVELERSGEICVGKNRCHGLQSFQVIEGLLAPTEWLPFSCKHFHPKLTHAGVRLPL